MSSVDNRIVILTFDNKDFESNVKTSIDSLDKLKNGLNLKDSAKGLTAISESTKGFSLSGINDAIEATKYRFSTLGVIGATVVSEITKTAMGLGHKLINAVAAPLTQGGWKRAFNIEQAQFQLEGLGVTWDSISEDINYGVKDTAYGLDVAARAASQLSASGVQVGDDMKAALRGISGVAAMTASSYEEISPIFTTVAGQGKLMTMQLRQLEMRGLNVAAVLGKELGYTEAEIREMVRKSEIDFDTFSKAMDNAFGEHAKEANKTFSGSLANVKAALSRIGADVAASGLKNLRDIFNALIPLIDNVRSALQPLIKKFNEFGTKATKGIVNFINGLTAKTPTAKKNITDLKNVISALNADGFKDFNKLAEAFGVTESELKDMCDGGRISLDKFISKMEEAFGDNAPKILERFKNKNEDTKESIKGTAEEVAKSAEEIEEAANRVIAGEFGNGETRREQLEALGLSFEEVQNKVNELLGCEYRYEVETKEVAAATEELAEATEEAAEKVNWFAGVTKQETAPAMESFKGALKNIGTTLFQVGSSIKSSFKEVFSGAFSNMIRRLARNLKEMTAAFVLSEDGARGLQKVFKGLFTIIKIIIKGLGWIATGFMKVIEIVGKAIGKILEFIGKADKAFEESGNKAKLMEALGIVIRKVAEIFVAFKNKVVEVGRAIAQSEGFQKLKAALSALWEVIKKFAQTIFDKFVSKLKEFGNFKPNFSWIDAIASGLSKVMGKIADFIMALINGERPIKKFFTNLGQGEGVLSKFVRFLSKVKDAIFNFFKNLKLPNFGEKFSGIKEGIVNGFKNFKDSDFVTKIVDIFKALWEQLKGVNWENLVKKILGLVGVITAIKYVNSLVKVNNSIAGVANSLNNFLGGTNLQKIVETWKKRDFAQKFRDIALGIGILAASIYAISKIPVEGCKKALITLGIVIGELVALYGLTNLMGGGAGFEKLAGSLTGLGVGLLLLTISLSKLAKMDAEALEKGAKAIYELMFMLALATRVAGKSSFGTLFGMALAVDMLIPALWVLSKMKYSTLKKGSKALFEVIMILALGARLAGKSSFGTLFGMALAVDMLVPALLILGNQDWSVIKKGAEAIFLITTSLGLSSRLAGKSSFGTMIGMAVAVGVAAYALYKLADIDFDRLLGAAIALSGTMVAIGGAARLANGTKSDVATMVVVIAAISIAFWALCKLPMDATIAAAASLSGVAIAIAGALRLMPKMTSLKEAGLAIGSFIVLLGSMVIAFKVMAELPIETTLAITEALSVTALSLSAALLLLSQIPLEGAKQGILGFDLFIADLTAVLAALGGLSKIPGFEELISAGAGIFGKLGDGIGLFIGGIIGGIGEGITNHLPKIAENLSDFAEKIQGFLSLKVDSGVIQSTANIADALIAITGASFLDSIRRFFSFNKENPYENIGNTLLSFAQPIIDYASAIQSSGIDIDVIEKSTNAAKLVAEFSKNIPNQGGKLAELLGDNTLSMFAEGLADFAPAIVDYAQIVKDGNIDYDAVESSTRAAQLIADFAKTIPNEGGILAEIMGDNTLTQFAEGLANFAPALVDYAEVIRDGNIDYKAVESSTRAAQLIADFASSIPNEGGILAKIMGDNTLTQFAEGLKDFAGPLVDYADTVREGNIDLKAVETSTRAAQLIADFASTIPNQGGKIAEWFTGDNTLKTFAEELDAFAPALVRYSNKVVSLNPAAVALSVMAGKILVDFYNTVKDVMVGEGIKVVWEGNPLKKFGEELAKFGPHIASYSMFVMSVNPAAVAGSARAGEMLATFYGAVKDVVSGGIKKFFEGRPLVNFGKELKDFGPYYKAFGDSLNGLDVRSITNAVNTLGDVIKIMEEINGAVYDHLSDYGTALAQFGSEFKKFYGFIAVTNWSDLKRVIPVLYDLIRVCQEMDNVDPSTVASFSGALQSCAEMGIEGFISAFENAMYDAYDVGSRLVEHAGDGVQMGRWSVDWYGIGQDAIQGFINGMSDMYWSVYNEAYDVAYAAVTAAKNALDEASPSKAMKKIGSYAGEGLVIGLEQMSSSVYSAGEEIGHSVLDAISNPLDKIKELLDSDMDLDPVITPVLDLSNINSGIGMLNGLLGGSNPSMTGTVGLNTVSNMGTLRALAANMSSQGLGNNADVVGAIGEMRQDITALGDSISKMQIRLDGQALVGSIIEPIDNALGMRAAYEGRGI